MRGNAECSNALLCAAMQTEGVVVLCGGYPNLTKSKRGYALRCYANRT